MKTQDNIITYKQSIISWLSSTHLKMFYVHLTFFIGGILTSSAVMFGEYAPFGASLVASAPFKSIIPTTLGTCIGYMIFSDSLAFRYVATIIAIIAIRWTLSDLKKINNLYIYPPLLAFIPMLATGLVLASVVDFSVEAITMSFIEALFSSGGAYFIFRSIKLSGTNRNLRSFTQQETASISVTACIVLLAFANIEFSGVSLGRIMAVTVIMFCAKYGNVVAGCVSSVVTGVLFSLTHNDLSYIVGSYSLGGLVSGLFSPLGRISVSLSFIFCSVLMSFQALSSVVILSTLYEGIFGAFIFLIIPKDVCDNIADIFISSKDKNKSAGMKKSIIMRLDFASRALKDVSSCVDNVAEKMKDLFTNDITDVYHKTTENVCANCGLRVYCLEKYKSNSMRDFLKLTDSLRKNGSITCEDFTNAYTKKCCKTNEMVACINKSYEDYIACLGAERRVGEIRSVVAGQFSGLGDILGEMAQEFETFDRFDLSSESKVRHTLKSMNITPIDVSCVIDKYERMCIEIETFDTNRNEVKKAEFTKQISKTCGRRFSSPSISMATNRCKVIMSERPILDTEIGTAQHISGNGQLCGDSFNYFNDGMGRMVVIISDGMGTGGRAAVDGSMAETIMTKLVKAGLGFDCALRVVNSALMVKSGDESLATLDIVCIDLFTGNVDILKAGAPLTIVKNGDKITTSNVASLPAGILTEIKFSHDKTTVSSGDWIVMVSDGAVSTGERWIEDLLNEKSEKGASYMAKEIIKEAKARILDGRDDDITAVAIKIHYDERTLKTFDR